MTSEEMQQAISDIQETLGKIGSQRVTQDQIIPGVIHQFHATDLLIKRGTAANRPTSGNPSCYAYFSTDTFVLSIWTGAVWKTTTLT